MSMNLHLLDGSAYIHRAYHAWPKLTRASDGHPTGAVLGFCEFLWGIIRRPVAERTHLAVVMDGGRSGRDKVSLNDGPARTAKRSDGYKSGRQKDDALIAQFPLINRACEAFGVKTVVAPGFEADDVIATLASACSIAGGKTVIHTSDKDMMQLVSPDVTIFEPMKKVHIGREQVIDKWGVPPERVTHVQALLGDAVDSIPGVPGIGEKTAKAIIQFCGNLDHALARAVARWPMPATDKQRSNLALYANDARLSLELATLKRDVPIGITLDELQTFVRDYRPIFEFCEEMEFADLMGRIEEQAA